ncbi:MAG: acetate--CoA ligase family protein [Nitrospirae bacterium]|nr:acetate--CoA ligase family protein [Nitrospirota bacterium]
MTKSCGLDPFFYPLSIAVVGASEDLAKPSGIIIRNLIHGFKGRIYPVNPKHPLLHGIPCFPSVNDIPGDVSLSVCITPTGTVPTLLGEHAQKGIHHVIIATAGFAETEGGDAIQREIKEIAGNAGIRIIGPNCLGIFHPYTGLDTFFLPYDKVPRPGAGNISIISQSGSILGTTLILMEQEGLGVAKAVSYGNRIDVGETELLEYLSSDEDTGVIGICIESVGDGRGFIRAARQCNKPIVVLKLGQQPAGKRASRSHTGSMSGRHEIFQAAFRRSGIYEADTLEEFTDLLKTFSMQRPHKGNRILIVTNAGGIGVMTADLCNREGLEVADLPIEPKERLRSLLPHYYSLSNPIDLTGNSTDEQFALVLRECLDYFDAALLIPFMTVPGVTTGLGRLLAGSLKDYNKPVASLHPFSEDGKTLEAAFMKDKIPVFPTPLRMVKAVAALLKDTHTEPVPENVREYPGIKSLLKDLQPGNVRGLPGAMNLRSPEYFTAGSQKETLAGVSRLRFPVAVKVVSPDVIHKTEVGGVRLGISGRRELIEAYREVISSVRRNVPEARVSGVIIEEMAPQGAEVIIGAIRDPDFGAVVMFGLGGTYTEILKDVIYDIAPVTHNGALRMIESIRGYDILKGVRGVQGIDMETLAEAIVRVSEVIYLFPEIMEMEFNPAIAYSGGLTVVDARVIM